MVDKAPPNGSSAGGAGWPELGVHTILPGLFSKGWMVEAPSGEGKPDREAQYKWRNSIWPCESSDVRTLP